MQILKSIQSIDNTQSIDLGIIPTEDMVVKLHFSPLGDGSDFYIGTDIEEDGVTQWKLSYSENQFTYYFNEEISLTETEKDSYEVELGNFYITTSAGTQSGTVKTELTFTNTIKVMCQAMKLYYLQIYKNNTLICDFVPCLDNNNIPCLFDLIFKKYYKTESVQNLLYETFPSYLSVAEMAAATTDNMTNYLNEKNDDGYVTIPMPYWVYLNNTKINNLLVNGNSYIGFNSNIKNIAINQRDCAVWKVDKEEGILLKSNRFVRVRWEGYSFYNTTAESEKMIYDIFIFDNGNIMINLLDQPSTFLIDQCYFSIGDKIYNFPNISESNSFVSLYTEDTTSNIYEVEYEEILMQPYIENKYLLQVDDKIFTYQNGKATEITLDMVKETYENPDEITEVTINAKLYQDFGMGFSKLFNTNLTQMISELFELYPTGVFNLLHWQEENDITIASSGLITATPPPQIIDSNKIIINPDDRDENYEPTILGISSVVIEGEGDFLITFSFNNNTSWKYWDGSAWQDTTEKTLGMTKEVVSAITEEQWYLLFENSDNYYIRVYLFDETQYVSSITVNYIN